MRRRLVLFSLIILLILPVAVAETQWAEVVSEDDSITFVTYYEKFTSTHNGTTYDWGLGSTAGNHEEIEVNPTQGMTSDFNPFEGDRLQLQVTHAGLTVDVPDFSDYHLVFLPLSINNTSMYSLLFDNKTLVQRLTGGHYQNSTIDDVVELNIQYRETFQVHYEWDQVTGTLISKTVTDPDGNQLRLLPQPNTGLITLPLTVISLSILVVTITIRRNRRT